jgi:N6-adenosine-specific RNA methylase IME4
LAGISTTWRIFDTHEATTGVIQENAMWGKQKPDAATGEVGSAVDASSTELTIAPPTDQPRELVLLGEAQRIIAEATSFDQIKEIRDKAEATRKYIESAQLGLVMQNHAAEVKLRAERRAGELLATMKLAGGDRRSEKPSGTTLEDLGISKHQSSRWQREAAVPEEVFERFVKEANTRSLELTTAALLRLARQFVSPRQQSGSPADLVEMAESVLVTLADLRAREEKFACIYADPPWHHVKDRPAVSVDSICELPVGELAEENAHLHLWVSNSMLFEAPRVMAAWGFEFRSCLVWVKPQRGPGDFWRISHEFLLLGTRGDLSFRDRGVISWVRINRRKHGHKPEKIRRLIERVSPGPYLQLFDGTTARGWTAADCGVNSPEHA